MPKPANSSFKVMLRSAYKKVCREKVKEQCFDTKKGPYLDGWNARIIHNSYPEDCKKACLEAKTFSC